MADHATQIKALSVYGVDNFGTDVFLPILDANLTAQSITISTSAVTQSSDGGNVPIDPTDLLFSDTDTIQLLHEGDDTAFDQTYRWRPDMSAIDYKTEVLLAIGLNVSSFTSGSIDLSDVFITITAVNQSEVLFKRTPFPIDMVAKTGATAAWFIFHADVVEQFKVYSGNPIDIRVEIPAASETGTSVTQTGILPIFPYSTPAVMKPFTPSGFRFHIHASLDHADPTYNQDITRVI